MTSTRRGFVIILGGLLVIFEGFILLHMRGKGAGQPIPADMLLIIGSLIILAGIFKIVVAALRNR